MMKRKVSAIWVVVLALIAIAACAFAAVTYYRCEKQPEPQFPENELLRVLDAGSDAEGVGFPNMPSGINSILSAVRPAKSATRKILLRRWARPQY